MSRDELVALFAGQNAEVVGAALSAAMKRIGLVGDQFEHADALRVLEDVAATEGPVAIGARFASARLLLQRPRAARPQR